MPADTVEIREGDEEGIERLNGWGPVEIRRDGGGAVTGVLLERCLRVYDDERRFAPRFDSGDRREVPADTVLLATGQATDLGFLADGGEDVEQARPGWPRVDPESLATTAPGVFLAGDLAHGTRLLIDAVASGKRAARSVYRHVTGRGIGMEALEVHVPLALYTRERGYEGRRRVEPQALAPDAVRALRRLRGRLPDAVPQARSARRPRARPRPRSGGRGRAGGRPDAGRAHGDPQGRGPLHPLRPLRPALSGGGHRHGAHLLPHGVETLMNGTSLPDSKPGRLAPEPVARRDFLGLAALSSAGAALLFALVGMLRLPKAAVLPSPSRRFRVTLPESLAAGEAFVPPGRAVALFRDAGGVWAVSTVCTHLGCIVKPGPDGFHCPCHGSRFAPDGSVVKGPAPRPLAQVAVVSLGSGSYLVDEATTVGPGTRELA
jgi:nitrite reductase/ring-hydroxylating ferredoxin subunit